MKHVGIIGGGITGLATAFYLRKYAAERNVPLHVTLIEAAHRAGGKILTETLDGFVMEGGPDSFITQKPWALELCRDLGIAGDLVPCNTEQQTVYLLRGGRLVPLPRGLHLTVPTRFLPLLRTPLLSRRGKLRMACEVFAPRRAAGSDESLASFVRRRLGREALETFAAPIMAGIHVSDAERMSMKSTFPSFLEMEAQHGSLIRALRRAHRTSRATGQRPSPLFLSPRSGMHHIVEALLQSIGDHVRLNSPVERVQARERGFEILLHAGSGESLVVNDVAVCAPAGVAGPLLDGVDPVLAGELTALRSVSTAVILLAYRRADLPAGFRFDGFGFLVPAGEQSPLLACTCSSNKFPGRAANGDMLFRVFVGGPRHEEFVHRADDDLLALARDELAALLGLRAEPAHHRVHRWVRGNPQYDVGHLDRMARIEQRVAGHAGLYLAGSSYDGVGIPDCIRSARKAAERIVSHAAIRGTPA